MEIRWLEAFVAVAEELHFGRAAERLGMAQSPLSQTVRRLERELDTTLFDRSTRSVALTPAGLALLPHVRRAFGELELGTEATRATDGLVHGTVAIGFSGALNHHTLSPLTRAVRHRYPNVTMVLTGRVMTGDGVVQVERGDLDIAFVGLPIDPSPLSTRLVAREPLGAVLPVDHRLAEEKEIDLAELAAEPFVATPVSAGSALQRLTVEACSRADFRPEVVQESTDPFLILTLVSAGVGVALMASSIAAIVPPGAVYVPLRDEPTYMEHAIAWRADNPSLVLSTVLEVAEEVLPSPE
ncbi:LysR family transcriptional regulator [Prauserella alba]|uniref:LysR family transcriptional regulator n=1 Tax=Prauserella alba TaxID=176898 RepID=A0ABP4FUH9_9PSEU|nr:LysR family transcriptional regulator [Prauserella alba]MCP2183169.1 DNA-binding transcriptional regulator, LysR family [Prauserella alba]